MWPQLLRRGPSACSRPSAACSARQTPLQPRHRAAEPPVTCQGHSPSAQSRPPTILIKWLPSSLELDSVLLRPSRCEELSVGPRSPGPYCSSSLASSPAWMTHRRLRPCVNFPQGKGSGRSAWAQPGRRTRSTPWEEQAEKRAWGQGGGHRESLGSGRPCVLLGGGGPRVGALTAGWSVLKGLRASAICCDACRSQGAVDEQRTVGSR